MPSATQPGKALPSGTLSISPGSSRRPVRSSRQGGDFAKMNRGLPIEVALDPGHVAGLRDERRAAHAGARRSSAPVRPSMGGDRIHQVACFIDRDRSTLGWLLQRPELCPFRRGGQTAPAGDHHAGQVDDRDPGRRGGPAAGAGRVTGFAWSGDAAIDRVEVSTDGGAAYADAEIVGGVWSTGLGQVPVCLGGDSWVSTDCAPAPLTGRVTCSRSRRSGT